MQPAARGGGELHGSKSRKSTANNSALFAVQHSPPILTDSACRPSLRSRYAAWANRPAPLRVAEAPHPFTAQSCRVRPRRASPAPLMHRCARGRRFLTESRYSLSPPNKAQSLAKAQPNSPPKSQPQARPNAARKPATVFEPEEQVTAPSTAQLSAPCSLHCGSAVAPPRLPSPAGISSRFCSPQNE